MRGIRLHSENGFTLLEVMVGLILATLMVGGVMGAISAALQYSHRVKEKGRGWSVLEAAAQEILTHPEKAEKDSLTLEDLPDDPRVDIQLTEVERPDGLNVGNRFGQLYQVQLRYEGSLLEFSVIVPESEL
jgi:Tfp pilus assembly protein PilV